MSQENVEIVRRAFEASVRHENESVFPLYDPEVEIDLTASGRGVYHGSEGVRQYFRDWLSAFEDPSWEVEEWIDAGEPVIAVMRLHGRGKLSGVPAEMLEAHVWTLRNGRLWRLRVYGTKAEAFEAAGLRGVGPPTEESQSG